MGSSELALAGPILRPFRFKTTLAHQIIVAAEESETVSVAVAHGWSWLQRLFMVFEASTSSSSSLSGSHGAKGQRSDQRPGSTEPETAQRPRVGGVWNVRRR